MTKGKIKMIAAVDKNNGIGYKNKLLTVLPNDMLRFRELTMYELVVMGRLTFESMNSKPLDNRTNIILTRDKNFVPKGENVYAFHNAYDVVIDYEEYNERENDLWIIGGSQLYSEYMKYAEELVLTYIDHEFSHVDSYFPEIPEDFKVTHMEHFKADEHNKYDHTIVTWTRDVQW